MMIYIFIANHIIFLLLLLLLFSSNNQDQILVQLFPNPNEADTLGYLFLNKEDSKIASILSSVLPGPAKKSALLQRMNQLKG